MPERDSWPVGSDTERIVDLDDVRIFNAAGMTPSGLLTARGGFRPSGGATNPGNVTASATPDGFVHVAPFVYFLPNTRGPGMYTVALDAPFNIDVLGIDPADSSNPRNDLIIGHQADTYYGDADSKFRVRRVKGTPSATPQDPPLTAYPNYVPLKRIKVPAGATTIRPVDLEDIATTAMQMAVALGGTLPVKDRAERDAIINPFDGLKIWRRDRDWTETFDGIAWRVQGIAVCTSTTDRDSAITSPYAGQLAITTDTTTVWVRVGSAWQEYRGVGLPRGLVADARDTASSQQYNAETVVMAVTFTAVAGRRYEWRANVGWTVNASTTTFAVRWATGTTTTVTGPVLWSERHAVPTPAGFNRFKSWDDIAPGVLPAGQVTLSLTALNTDGIAGGFLNAEASNVRTMQVYDIGT